MPANPSAFVAHAREVLAKATPGPLKTRDDVGVFDECGRFVADHGDVWGANLHVLAVNSLAALCDVVEAAGNMRKVLGWLEPDSTAYLIRDHACIRCVPYGDSVVPGFLCGRHAYDASLARLEVPE